MATAMNMQPAPAAPRGDGRRLVAPRPVLGGGQVSPFEAARAGLRRDRMARQRAAFNQARVDYILERVEHNTGVRQKFEGLWREAFELFHPNREATHGGSKGEKKTRAILDSTPALSLKRWANRRLQQLFPPGQPAISLRSGADIPPEAAQGFERRMSPFSDRLNTEIASSNAGQEIYQAMRDAGVCQGAVLILPHDDARPFRVECTPPMQLVLEEGPFGGVDSVARVRRMSVRLILRTWPDFAFSPDVERQLQDDKEEGRGDRLELEIVEACWFNAEHKGWDYCAIEKKARHAGHVRAFEWSPWVVFRDDVDHDEHQAGPYGRGPVLTALPDARTLQRVKDLVLRNAALAIAGVYTATDDDVLDIWTLRLEPGAIMPVAKHETLKPLETSHDFNVSDLVMKDLQQSILETMDAAGLPPIDTTVRSATEILARESQAAADSFAGAARMQVELVRPFAQVVAYILRERGRMPDLEFQGREVKVEFEGPLALAQRQQRAVKLGTLFQLIAPLGQAAIALRLKDDVLVAKAYEALGLWPEAMRTDDEVAETRGQLAEQAALLAQLKAGGQLTTDAGGGL